LLTSSAIARTDEAKLVLQKVKALNRDLESSPPPLPEVGVPSLSTYVSRALETVNDDNEDEDVLSIREKEEI
jgi:hypothetical protein